MSRRVTLVVHGHFYQPPRENPWTGEVAREPSAAPFHDWNARIAAECYRPNAFARIIDSRNRLVSIVDNYRLLSYDLGPTLLSWLERHDPVTYRRLIAADLAMDGGMAQGFGHLIMPLCNERDLRTQIRWGITDFEFRYGRRAEGMWLPEAAVNDSVLQVLAEEGIKFTLLAPGQAGWVRSLNDPNEAWGDLPHGSIDTRRPYRWEHPAGGGLGIDVVFYDGGLSHDIAFGLGSMNSQGLLDRVDAAGGAEGGLVTVAADGETFGHHHRYGDRLLAYALAVEAPRRGIEVTTLARYLRENRPEDEVKIKESSWSCAHGVGRWREDCGCSTGGEPGWNQRWRAPLRQALDTLRDRNAAVFERLGKQAFTVDPWKARDEYVRVLIGELTRQEFVERYGPDDAVTALTLLEAQHNAMSMYPSCGWFFNDGAGLETVQVLRYAARVMDLLREVGEDPAEEAFLEILSQADSNVAAEGNGRKIWRTHVEPARVDAARVVAHLALAELLEEAPAPDRLAGWDVKVVDHSHATRGSVALCSGPVALEHGRTGRRHERVFAAVRLGALEVLGASRPAAPRRDEDSLTLLREAFAKGAPLLTLLRMVGDNFGARDFNLMSALPDGAEQIVTTTATTIADRFAATFERVFEDHRPTLEALAALGQPLPPEMRAVAELTLARRFEAAVAAQAGSSDPGAYREAIGIARSARETGFRIDTPQARARIEGLLLDAVRRAVAATEPEDEQQAVDAALATLQLAEQLDLHLNVDPSQEILYEPLLTRSTPVLRVLGVGLHLAVETLGSPA